MGIGRMEEWGWVEWGLWGLSRGATVCVRVWRACAHVLVCARAACAREYEPTDRPTKHPTNRTTYDTTNQPTNRPIHQPQTTEPKTHPNHFHPTSFPLSTAQTHEDGCIHNSKVLRLTSHTAARWRQQRRQRQEQRECLDAFLTLAYGVGWLGTAFVQLVCMLADGVGECRLVSASAVCETKGGYVCTQRPREEPSAPLPASSLACPSQSSTTQPMNHPSNQRSSNREITKTTMNITLVITLQPATCFGELWWQEVLRPAASLGAQSFEHSGEGRCSTAAWASAAAR
jgi:hypothetical protein